MIEAGDLEKGLIIKVDKQLFKVLDYEFMKMGRGIAHVKASLKNLKTGNIIKKTFRSTERLEEVELSYQSATFLYKDRKSAVFLRDGKRISFPLEEIGDKVYYLTERLEVKIIYLDETPYSIELPIKVDLKVIDTPPYIKGATVASNTKLATLETGLKVKVPMFIKPGDVIRVNTETGEYTERIK